MSIAPRRASGPVLASWCLGGVGVGCVLTAAGFFAAGGYRVAVLYGNEIGIALGFTAVGAVVAARATKNPLGWLMLCAGVVHAAGLLALELLGWLGPDVSRAPGAFVTYAETSWMPGFVTLFTLVPLLFPTGRPVSPRWRWLVWSSGVSGATVLFATIVGTKRWTDFNLPNAAYHPTLSNVVVIAGPVMVISVVGSIASVVVRYRRSSGVLRQQLRWFVWACLVAIVVLVPELVLNRHTIVTVVLQLLVVLGVPLAIGIAILRYRLYDIDRVISRTVSYVIVTGVLVGCYVGVVALATRLLPFSSAVGVAASTLFVAAAFNPLRRRVQAGVDRRFNRARYDAARTVDVFAARLRDEVDPELVRLDLLDVTARAVQPTRVSLWLAG